MTNGDKVREKLKDNTMLAGLYVYQPETYRGGIRYWRATHVGKFEDYGDAFNAEMKWLQREKRSVLK